MKPDKEEDRKNYAAYKKEAAKVDQFMTTKQGLSRKTEKDWGRRINRFLEVMNKKPSPNTGTQLIRLCAENLEGGESNGLGWFDAEVKLIEIKNKKIKIPNIGWEEIKKNKNSLIFKNINSNLEFYFIHSYFMDCKNKNDITSFYNIENKLITASIEKENIFGTQFHPEKSDKIGLKIIDNFINL